MNFLNKMERKFGKYAIHNLMFYIIVLYGCGFLIMNFAPAMYWSYLSLDVRAILHGQIWRLVTFLMYPPSSDFLFIVFSLYLYYMIGRQLEYQWGAFRFNVYFFVGVIGHILAAFIAYFALGLTGITFPMTTYYLNLSLFMAFAAQYPDMEFLLFFIIPVKAKWLGMLDGVLFAWDIFRSVKNGILISPSYFATAVCALMAVMKHEEIQLQGSASQEGLSPGGAPCGIRPAAQVRHLRTDRGGRRPSGIPLLLQMQRQLRVLPGSSVHTRAYKMIDTNVRIWYHI